MKIRDKPLIYRRKHFYLFQINKTSSSLSDDSSTPSYKEKGLSHLSAGKPTSIVLQNRFMVYSPSSVASSSLNKNSSLSIRLSSRPSANPKSE